MIFLGFGKYVRADKIYALEPLEPGERGHGARTRVWVEGIAEPIVASRTERAIVAAMGSSPARRARCSSMTRSTLRSGSRRPPSRAGSTSVDLGRRARRLLESTARQSEAESLF